MLIWILLILPSVLTGVLCAYFLRNKMGFILSTLLPWFGLLVAILYEEYFTPYEGGGASMWPIAQFFGGAIAAIIGAVSFLATRKCFQSKLIS